MNRIMNDRLLQFRLVLGALVSLVLVLFIADNFVTVEVRLIFWSTQTRLAWALLIAGGLGFLAGVLLPTLGRRRKRED
jgi:uncharacterized integral membrane protein